MSEIKQQPQPNQQQFAIQRIYVKDLSFEAPNTPEVFQAEWKPEVNLDITANNKSVKEDTFEVVLKLTLTVKSNQNVAFVAEVQQAGIFTAKNFQGEQQKHVLGSFCPTILYPYAREAVASLISRGGFPAMHLAPINFDAIYAQQQKTKQDETIN